MDGLTAFDIHFGPISGAMHNIVFHFISGGRYLECFGHFFPHGKPLLWIRTPCWCRFIPLQHSGFSEIFNDAANDIFTPEVLEGSLLHTIPTSSNRIIIILKPACVLLLLNVAVLIQLLQQSRTLNLHWPTRIQGIHVGTTWGASLSHRQQHSET